MKRRTPYLRGKPKGFTLVGVLAAATVLAILATFIGKNLYYLIRARLRTEAKVSVVDSESTFSELVAARVVSMINSITFPVASPQQRCQFANFADTFNQMPPIFPGSRT
ncbi:MAG: type II secretion system protein, partial [Pseudomonadota bacterium]